MKEKNKRKKGKWWVPAALILFAAGMNGAARLSGSFSQWYAAYVFPFWVETYGRITGMFPFSVGEWMLYLAVFLVLAAVFMSVLRWLMGKKISEKGKLFYKRYLFFLYWVFGAVCLVMTLNCFLLYQVPPISSRFKLGEGGADTRYGTEQIAILRDYVVEQANELALVMERDSQGYIIYEGDMEEEARRQMKRLGESFRTLKGYYPKPKKLALSGFYSQQYIMGYYFPFSMEANYNSRMYITNMPATLCHELSHLKGFILEDEANFLGYLACVDAEDPLFCYSAYLSVITYLDRDFYDSIGKDAEQYLTHPQISGQVKEDKIFLTGEAWEQVEKTSLLDTQKVKQASNTFLDTTLTLNGVKDGVASYSRVVELLLQYYDGKLY